MRSTPVILSGSTDWVALGISAPCWRMKSCGAATATPCFAAHAAAVTAARRASSASLG